MLQVQTEALRFFSVNGLDRAAYWRWFLKAVCGKRRNSVDANRGERWFVSMLISRLEKYHTIEITLEGFCKFVNDR